MRAWLADRGYTPAQFFGGIVIGLIIALGVGLWVAHDDGPPSARRTCERAVVKEYEDADKVLQQPSDLNAFCATWDDHPPGLGLP